MSWTSLPSLTSSQILPQQKLAMQLLLPSFLKIILHTMLSLDKFSFASKPPPPHPPGGSFHPSLGCHSLHLLSFGFSRVRHNISELHLCGLPHGEILPMNRSTQVAKFKREQQRCRILRHNQSLSLARPQNRQSPAWNGLPGQPSVEH